MKLKIGRLESKEDLVYNYTTKERCDVCKEQTDWKYYTEQNEWGDGWKQCQGCGKVY